MPSRTQSLVNSIGALVDRSTVRLDAAGVESARLDVELMLARSARCSRAAVMAGAIELNDDAIRRFEGMVSRRAGREPLAYILGEREFFSIDFEVTPAVLIPRPETETLVAAALEFIAGRADARVIDVGTGSGAIAIAIAANAPEVSVVATDIDEPALAVARRNVERHRLASRVKLRRADIFEPLDTDAQLGRFDLIVANPPYVESSERPSLAPEVRDFEPAAALYAAGQDPLSCYRRIAEGARSHLVSDGALMVEVGGNQAPEVANIFRRARFHVAAVINDLAGIARVVTARV